MPHDPSECPRCCWAAERLGYQYFILCHPDIRGDWINIKGNGRNVSSATGFCGSLDAVAGLMKEMQDYGVWVHQWDVVGQVWIYRGGWLGSPCFDSPEDLPGACVIEAAMQVLDS